jgi:hypothetical protein
LTSCDEQTEARDKMLALAHRTATADQRKSPRRGQRRVKEKDFYPTA